MLPTTALGGRGREHAVLGTMLSAVLGVVLGVPCGACLGWRGGCGGRCGVGGGCGSEGGCGGGGGGRRKVLPPGAVASTTSVLCEALTNGAAAK